MIDREIPERPREPRAKEVVGPMTRRLTPFTRWIVTNLIAPPLVFGFFHLLNQTRIYGRRRLPGRKNTLLVANHQSMIDSFPIAYLLFYPHWILRPFLAPWSPAAQENFFRRPVLAWVFHQFKCIPVRPGRRDLRAMIRSVRALRNGSLILFPEGTRSRDGEVGRGRPGAGMVILQTGARVIPIAIDGMDRILPIGTRVPRIGRRLSIYIGRPLNYADLAAKGRSRETAQEIVDRAMERIAFQRRVLARLNGARRQPEARGRGDLDIGA